MRTRRSPRNQEILWRALGRQGAEAPAPVAPTRTREEIDAMWWLPKQSRRLMLRDLETKQVAS